MEASRARARAREREERIQRAKAKGEARARETGAITRTLGAPVALPGAAAGVVATKAGTMKAGRAIGPRDPRVPARVLQSGEVVAEAEATMTQLPHGMNTTIVTMTTMVAAGRVALARVNGGHPGVVLLVAVEVARATTMVTGEVALASGVSGPMGMVGSAWSNPGGRQFVIAGVTTRRRGVRNGAGTCEARR